MAKIRWTGLATLAVLSWAGGAAALTFQPSPFRRMAVTDRAVDVGLQARVWTVTLDGFLTSKRPDVNDYGWTLHACCVDSSVDAVSWTDGSVARQRVFFAREGAMHFLNHDGDFFDSFGALPAPAAGIEFGATDVAALTWLEGETRRVAVSAISQDGRLCVWNGNESGFTSSPYCSTSSWAATSDADLVGAVVGNVPIFAYRRSNGVLAVTRPFLTSWYGATIGIPTGDSGSLRPSLAIFPSVASPGQAEVIVVGASGRLHAARFAPLSNSETWTALPVLPDGALPTSQGNAVAAQPYTTFDFGSGSFVTRVGVYVASSSRRLYRAYSTSSGAWSSWTSGSHGFGARPPSDQSWYGNGVAYTGGSFLFSGPALFGAGGVNAIFAAHLTTQEFTEAGFKDHLFLSHVDHDVALGSVGSSTQPANESTASLSPILGIASAIRRNSNGLPWQIVVSQTQNGGSDWTDDLVVRPAAGWPNPGTLAALTDPYTAIEPSGRFHHLALEVPLVYPTPGGPNCSIGAGSRRLVYRNGSSASQIANSTAVSSSLRILAVGSGLDHGGLALTQNAAGVTPHVVFTGPAGVQHWFRTPAGTETTVPLPALFGPPGVFEGAGEELFAHTISGQLCRLHSGGGGCVETGSMGGTTRMPLATPTISFGPVDTSDPKATCSGRRCFDTPQPIGYAAHPTIPRQIYAAYQGSDPAGGASIYFQKNDGSSLNVWTAPVRINARGFGDTTNFIDPSITVDHEGTLIVTYSRADTTAPSFTQYSAYSTDGGATFTVTRLPVSWRPNDLPFHCHRGRFFVGEYREGSSVGNRAFNLLHKSSSTTGNTVLTNYWASRWSVNGS